jgi:hypothetical protein
MDERRRAMLPDDVRDGDVLVYMSGRLLVVDHLVPEAWTIDLVELHEAEGLPPVPTSERAIAEPVVDLRNSPRWTRVRDLGAT